MSWITRAFGKLMPYREGGRLGWITFFVGLAVAVVMVAKIAPVWYESFLIRDAIKQTKRDVTYQSQETEVQKRVGELYRMKEVEGHDPKDVRLIRSRNDLYLEYNYEIDIEWPIVTEWTGYQTPLIFEIRE